jgi:hypothetical protein
MWGQVAPLLPGGPKPLVLWGYRLHEVLLTVQMAEAWKDLEEVYSPHSSAVYANLPH